MYSTINRAVAGDGDCVRGALYEDIMAKHARWRPVRYPALICLSTKSFSSLREWMSSLAYMLRVCAFTV